MTHLPKIFLANTEVVNWALSTDMSHMRAALSTFADLSADIESADCIQSATWWNLLTIDEQLLSEKLVITAVSHDIRVMLQLPEYLRIAKYVDHWIVPSLKAHEYMNKMGLPNTYIPHGYDEVGFYTIGAGRKKEIREKYGLPQDKYLIGSFVRDTEGKDLVSPKYVKGPDVLLEILKKVWEKDREIHVVLAGPRRFWIKSHLQAEGIPFTFIGEDIQGADDMMQNALPAETINELMNAIDLTVVPSRREGGPLAILEAAATSAKIISTDVGIATDVLAPEQIFTNFVQAAEMVTKDIQDNFLASYLDINRQKLKNHQLKYTTKLYHKLYQQVHDQQSDANIIFKPISQLGFRKWNKLLPWRKTISVFYQFHKGPWGGANQFLSGLSKYLAKKGWKIKHDLGQKVVLFNSFHIDLETMAGLRTRDKLMLHRIDGPTVLIRDKDQELDDNIFEVNNKVADVSIFQSAWSFFATLDLGYKPVNPVLITNAADPDIFFPGDMKVPTRNRKIRLISTSWSDNPKKGGPIYKWLDQHLDWDKYEYTFVGRVSERLENIKVVDPKDPSEMGEVLREHDIYITASDNDPCSNALVEAQTCGLPAIYYNRGGHPEIVEFGGLGFDNKEQIPGLLQLMAENYDSFRSIVVPAKIDDVGDAYLECISLALESR